MSRASPSVRRCAPRRSVWFPALVTRISSAQLTAERAVLHVDAALPLTTAIDDVAFPGNELAGAHLVDITVVDTSGHRRTLNAELPAHVSVTGTIVLALRGVSTQLPTVESAPRRSRLTVDGQW